MRSTCCREFAVRPRNGTGKIPKTVKLCVYSVALESAVASLQFAFPYDLRSKIGGGKKQSGDG